MKKLRVYWRLIGEELNVKNVYMITRGYKVNYNLADDKFTVEKL